MKKKWKSGSKLIDSLFEQVGKYKKVEIECYDMCKNILKETDGKELYHAKAILEQRMSSDSGLRNTLSNAIEITAILVSVSALFVSIYPKGMLAKLRSEIIKCIIMVFILLFFFIFAMFTYSKRKNEDYIYSLICSEIESRRKLVKKKRKKKCQNK